jgi:hypothetical protein
MNSHSYQEPKMFRFIKIVTALGICLASLLGHVETSGAQQNPVTAVDIALEPDQTMIQHAQADNARLLKAFPKGFALDATHHPHVTMLQQFVGLGLICLGGGAGVSGRGASDSQSRGRETVCGCSSIISSTMSRIRGSMTPSTPTFRRRSSSPCNFSSIPASPIKNPPQRAG